jgi:hypothetical protein
VALPGDVVPRGGLRQQMCRGFSHSKNKAWGGHKSMESKFCG